MKEQLFILEKLQAVNIKIRKIEEDLKKYPEEISNFNDELQNKKEVIDTKKSNLKELNKLKTQFEFELKRNVESIKRSEDKLFEIKTHKEYESLQKEIAERKKSNSELEEQILVKMDEIEKLEYEVEEDETVFSRVSEEYSAKISEREKKIKELKTNYNPIKEEEERLTAKVDAKVFSVYQRIFNRLGEALALTRNEVCTSCNMNIPPQLFNEVLTQNKILQCPNCKKILYIDSTDQENN